MGLPSLLVYLFACITLGQLNNITLTVICPELFRLQAWEEFTHQLVHLAVCKTPGTPSVQTRAGSELQIWVFQFASYLC